MVQEDQQTQAVRITASQHGRTTLTWPLSDTELQGIAEDINVDFKRAATHIIAAGRKLLKAKARAGHGQFERLFEDHTDPILKPIHCTARYARTLMAIAGHPVLTKSEHCSVLPHTVSTLYGLSKLPAYVVERGIEDKLIRPEMQRHDVKLLKDEAPMTTSEERAKRREQQEKRRIKELLRRTWIKYPRHRLFFLSEVKALEESEEDEGMNFEGVGPR